MPLVELNDILEATLRASPNYELVLFDRLSPEEQRVLQGHRHCYGLLCSRERTDLGVKAVCENTALLYVTLNQPGRVPAYFRTLFGDRCNQAIAELVLDGILEIDSNGTFVSGSQAYRLIHGDCPQPEASGIIATRSIEALKYAQALNISESQTLSARLYAYGRQPVSPYWKRRFPRSEAVAEHLGIRAKSAGRSLLDPNWLSVSLPNDSWFRWNSRHERQRHSNSQLTYKLYVSPASEFVRDAFHTTVRVISELRAPSFKVGADVYGMLRPDKIIVYFSGFKELQEASARLSRGLSGCPAHGVPFTAETFGDGLLSWGIDPPRDQPMLTWRGPESWRLWVTNHLAIALLSAKASPSDGLEPWQFALERLRFEGIDTQSWTPTRSLWVEDVAEKG